MKAIEYYECGSLSLTFTHEPDNLYSRCVLIARCGNQSARTVGYVTPYLTADIKQHLLSAVIKKRPAWKVLAEYNGKEYLIYRKR
jgi:hypothetical protein